MGRENTRSKWLSTVRFNWKYLHIDIGYIFTRAAFLPLLVWNPNGLFSEDSVNSHKTVTSVTKWCAGNIAYKLVSKSVVIVLLTQWKSLILVFYVASTPPGFETTQIHYTKIHGFDAVWRIIVFIATESENVICVLVCWIQYCTTFEPTSLASKITIVQHFYIDWISVVVETMQKR